MVALHFISLFSRRCASAATRSKISLLSGTGITTERTKHKQAFGTDIYPTLALVRDIVGQDGFAANGFLSVHFEVNDHLCL